jgi:hypothetical protein
MNGAHLAGCHPGVTNAANVLKLPCIRRVSEWLAATLEKTSEPFAVVRYFAK